MTTLHALTLFAVAMAWLTRSLGWWALAACLMVLSIWLV